MIRLHPTLIAAPAAIMPVVRMLAVAAVAAALAGCYSTTAREGVPDAAAVPTDYRQRHPIVIQEKDHTVELFIGNGRGELAPADRATVLAFAGTWRREASGGVVIEVPSGTANERAAHDATREVRALLVGGGVPDNAIALQPYRPRDPRQLATIRLNYPRVAADAGPCGLWPKDIGLSDFRESQENSTYWNFGCANQRNMAAMIDHPADLVGPRGETPAYEGRRTIVLEKYRKGEATATTYPNADKGKISSVGQ